MYILRRRPKNADCFNRFLKVSVHAGRNLEFRRILFVFFFWSVAEKRAPRSSCIRFPLRPLDMQCMPSKGPLKAGSMIPWTLVLRLTHGAGRFGLGFEAAMHFGFVYCVKITHCCVAKRCKLITIPTFLLNDWEIFLLCWFLLTFRMASPPRRFESKCIAKCILNTFTLFKRRLDFISISNNKR